MRDHYVGDISDLLKFALLRALAANDRVLGIAWYYSQGVDKAEDGRHQEWRNESSWKSLDPVLHTWLAGLPRAVKALEDLSFWPPDTVFHREPIPPLAKRAAWLKVKRKQLEGTNLVFLDPDNGIGKPSNKHATLHELKTLRKDGRAIGFITFPHQGRKHKEQLRELHSRIREETGSTRVITLRISVSLPNKSSTGFVPRTRWFTFMDFDSVLEKRLFVFKEALDKMPRVSASLDQSESHMRTYTVIYERGHDGGWGAYVPDLPGLGVAAETFEKVDQLIREGIIIHLDGLKEDGLLIPEPTTLAARVTVAA